MTSRDDGFTMIELLIAMSIFTFMLMIVSVAFINIVRVHQAGISSRAVQQNARVVLDQIVAMARRSNEAIIPSGGHVRVCFSTTAGVTEYELTDASDPVSGNIISGLSDRNCPDAMPGTYTQMNDDSVAFLAMDSSSTGPLGASAGAYLLTLTAASRNNLGAINATKDGCDPGVGSQFCSIITVTSTAGMRGGK